MTRCSTVALAVAVSTCGVGCARSPAARAYTLKSVGHNVWAAIDTANSASSAGSNAGFVVGTNAVAVIDTLANTDAAKYLLADIRKQTHLPIKWVIDTHYHADHVANNGVFLGNGAVILAQRNVRDWIHAQNIHLISTGLASAQQTMSPAQRASIEAYVTPTAVYEGSVDLDLGGRQVLVRSFPGHTGGDSVVFVPDAKVTFTGDLYWHDNPPNLVDASTKDEINTLNVLAANNADMFVPGHGDVGDAQSVTTFRDYLIALRTLTAKAQSEGKTGDGLVNAVMPSLTAQYGRWAYFDALAPLNVQQTDAELRGVKEIPRPATQ